MELNAEIPADLGEFGRGLWVEIDTWREEQDLILDPHELPLVAELCRTVDRLATIRGALETVGVTAPAWTRLAGEERQQRLCYGRVVSALGFPSGVVPDSEDAGRQVGLSPRSRRAQKAARTRWDVFNATG